MHSKGGQEHEYPTMEERKVYMIFAIYSLQLLVIGKRILHFSRVGKSILITLEVYENLTGPKV